MEIRYRREMRHNYLVIEPEASRAGGYESRMMSDNKIEGLLRFHTVRTDDKISYYYEITSRQPLLRILESRSITRTELSGLILEIAATLERLEAYLLPEEQILLEPEYIYVEPETFRVSFCLVPGSSRDFPQAVGTLLQFLLGNVDHQDKDCVVLIYGLYQESQKDNYGMEDLLKLLGREERDSGPPFYRDQDGIKPQTTGVAGNTDRDTTGSTVKGYIPNGKRKGTKETAAAEKEKHTGWPGWRNKFFKTRAAEKENQSQGAESWQAYFEEAEETEIKRKERNEQEPTTVLLTDGQAMSAGYYLEAMQPGIEDIAVTSFPFIIGKQSSLADYVLEKETVSRLHARIEEDNGTFRITDLNSTNGTRVRGRLLENNESERLQIGDEVQIAEWRYRFLMGSSHREI